MTHDADGFLTEPRALWVLFELRGLQEGDLVRIKKPKVSNIDERYNGAVIKVTAPYLRTMDSRHKHALRKVVHKGDFSDVPADQDWEFTIDNVAGWKRL